MRMASFCDSGLVLTWLNGDKLCRIIEELLHCNIFTLPLLIGKFLHVCPASILPFEVEYPPNDDNIAIDEYLTHSLRAN